MKTFSRFLAGLFIVSSWSFTAFAQGNFTRGDVNCDGVVNSADVPPLQSYIFSGSPIPPCLDAADVNDDGVINPIDITRLNSYLGGGPAPAPPFPNCGTDPTMDALTCAASCCTPANHYKTWVTSFIPFSATVQVRDQFMTDNLQLTGIQFLSNPVRKVVAGDTSNIIDPDDHLLWYQARGRRTLLQVDYVNQFESTTVTIDTVLFFLTPAQKLPHPTYDSLDHYKAYRIISTPPVINLPVQLQDQFDLTPEQITSLRPIYFLTPAQKNVEPVYDTVTHYVAYQISPPRTISTSRTVIDQFGSRTVNIGTSLFLLVPTRKLAFRAPECNDGVDNDGDGFVDYPADCGCTSLTDFTESPNPMTACSDGIDNDGDGLIDLADPDCANVCDKIEGVPLPHYKTWSTNFISIPPITVQVRDQFKTEVLTLNGIRFLSNPVQKIAANDTFNIVDPDDHLLWYQVQPGAAPSYLRVDYVNQFEDTSRFISMTAQYFLVPAQKLPHPPYDSLDHYKAYPITNSTLINVPVQLQDQFDLTPEQITSLRPIYFLTPAQKNAEPVYDTITHYVAYLISPPRTISTSRTVIDQFGTRTVTIGTSQLLLVPTRKTGFRPPECSDGLDNDGDGLIDFPADCGCTGGPADDSEAPNATTQCSDGIDNDGDGLIDLADCGCASPCDFTESPNPPTQCSDGVDNDGDGLIDLADPDCANVCDTSEATPLPECSDGVDNDGDGLVDFPADCGCTAATDLTEAPNPPTQCSDGVDNDGDGLVDLADPDCANVCDTAEGVPPPPGPNHYKTWRTFDLNAPVFRSAFVQDQFMQDNLRLDTIQYLSNPTVKIVVNDTFHIVDPDDHLTWYRATGRDTLLSVVYRNQFTPQDTVHIDSVRYLLVPTQKFPHMPPTNLDHYKAYRIRDPQPFSLPLQLQDQFLPEGVNLLVPRYFLTPARKNTEPVYDTTTHYLAYEFSPKRILGTTRQTQDQFGFHNLRIDSSVFLLVPTEKVSFCRCDKGDINCDGNLSPSDIVCLLNCVFLGGANPPCDCDQCVADVNCNGSLSPSDVVLELNRVYLGLTDPPWCGL